MYMMPYVPTYVSRNFWRLKRNCLRMDSQMRASWSRWGWAKKILEGPLDELPYTNAVMRGEPMKCLLVNFLFGSLGKSCWAKKQKLWQKCLSSPSENSSIYLINCMRMNIVVVSRYFGIHFNTFLEKYVICEHVIRRFMYKYILR